MSLNFIKKNRIYFIEYPENKMYIYQLWTFYEVNMLYMDLLGLYWPKTKSEVNI